MPLVIQVISDIASHWLIPSRLIFSTSVGSTYRFNIQTISRASVRVRLSQACSYNFSPHPSPPNAPPPTPTPIPQPHLQPLTEAAAGKSHQRHPQLIFFSPPRSPWPSMKGDVRWSESRQQAPAYTGSPSIFLVTPPAEVKHILCNTLLLDTFISSASLKAREVSLKTLLSVL